MKLADVFENCAQEQPLTWSKEGERTEPSGAKARGQVDLDAGLLRGKRRILRSEFDLQLALSLTEIAGPFLVLARVRITPPLNLRRRRV